MGRGQIEDKSKTSGLNKFVSSKHKKMQWKSDRTLEMLYSLVDFSLYNTFLAKSSLGFPLLALKYDLKNVC